jgi:hypothetical protein
VGVLEREPEGRTRLDQQFFRPDGTRFRGGHESWFDDAGAHHTQSFDIQEDGTWKKRRLYVWKPAS